MTEAQIYERLGLEPATDYARSRGYGRGSGTTTRMLVYALAKASVAERVLIYAHSAAYANDLQRTVREYSERLAIDASIVRVLPVSAAPRTRGFPGAILRDHHLGEFRSRDELEVERQMKAATDRLEASQATPDGDA
jgi:hypothetical protein